MSLAEAFNLLYPPVGTTTRISSMLADGCGVAAGSTPRHVSWHSSVRPNAPAAEQRQRIDEAIDSRKTKQHRPYAWPSFQKGVSESQVALQRTASAKRLDAEAAQREVECMTKSVSLIQLGDVELPELIENAHGDTMANQSLRQEWASARFDAQQAAATDLAREPSVRRVRQRHRLDDLIELGLDHASADGKRGRQYTGVRAWFAFCEDVMATPADRPMDPLTTPLWEKLEDEWLAMRFVCALVQDRGITPTSAGQYFSSVQGWHAREHGVKLAGGLKLERLPQMLKGLRRVIGETPKPLRRAVAPKALRLAMDLLLDPRVPEHANMRAALAMALQGLLRSAEYTSKLGKVDKYTIMRSDVRELRSERMIVMMHPGKNMHHLGGKTCPLLVGGGGEYVDAVAEVMNLLAVDPIPEEAAAYTPLFRDPATNTPLRYDAVNACIKRLMQAVGEPEAGFSTHSLRIGGATALFAAGANETVIRTMGRWSSDLHRLYVRACEEQCCEWTRRAGSTSATALVGAEFDEVDDY
jgi:hypothetical protein